MSRLNASPAERAARDKRFSAAVRTILECIGEDPDREGLLRTPERYAQALMWMTRGYEERLAGQHLVQITHGPFRLGTNGDNNNNNIYIQLYQ